MLSLEDDLKLQNWLSVLTFDVFKYVKAGGQVMIEWADDGLVLRLPGVQFDSEGVNSKFKGLANSPEAAEVEPETPTAG